MDTRVQPTVLAPRRRHPAGTRPALLLAIAATATCWLPLAGVIAWPMLGFAISYGADALARAHRTGQPRWACYTALTLSYLAMAVATALMLNYLAAWTDELGGWSVMWREWPP